MNDSNSGEIIFPGIYCAVKAENRAASQKSRFLRSARRKAQEYSEGLSSIFNAAGREKIPFEAVYPYVSAPKEQIFVAGKAKSAGILGASSEHF